MANNISITINAQDNATRTIRGVGTAATDTAKVVAVAGTAIAAAAAVFTRAVVGAASSTEEALNKVRVVFGKSSDAVEEFTRTATKNLALSRGEALAMAGTFGNLLTSMGLTRTKSAEMSTSILQLATDLSSFNDIPVAEALEKIRAGLVGEAEPLRALGVNISQVTMEQEAMRMGLLKAGETMGSAAKAQAAYALIMKQTANAQGDFARTSESVANAKRTLTANVQQLKEKIGTALMPEVQRIIVQMNRWFDQNGEQFAKDLAAALQNAGKRAGELADSLSRLASTPPVQKTIDIVASMSGDQLAIAALSTLLGFQIGGKKGALIGAAGLGLAASQGADSDTVLGRLQHIGGRVVSGGALGALGGPKAALAGALAGLGIGVVEAGQAGVEERDRIWKAAMEAGFIEPGRSRVMGFDEWNDLKARVAAWETGKTSRVRSGAHVDPEALGANGLPGSAPERPDGVGGENYTAGAGSRSPAQAIAEALQKQLVTAYRQGGEEQYVAVKQAQDRMMAVVRAGAEVLQQKFGIEYPDALQAMFEEQSRILEETLEAQRELLIASRDQEIAAYLEGGEARLRIVAKEQQDRAVAIGKMATDVAQKFGLEMPDAIRAATAAVDEHTAALKREASERVALISQTWGAVGGSLSSAGAAAIAVAVDRGRAAEKAATAWMARGYSGADAAALANAGATPMARGGIVMPRPGGTLARLAEAGRPEAVVPLPAGGQLGTTIHITVHAGMGTDGAQVGRDIARALNEAALSDGPVLLSGVVR